MSFMVYRDPAATIPAGTFETLEEALAALWRNYLLVLPSDYLAPEPIEIGQDAVTVHVTAPQTEITLGPDVTSFTLAGTASATIRTVDANTTVNGNDAGLTFYGGAARDIVNAGTGADALFGGAGDDVLRGGAGDDLLVAGEGRDRLEGGDGDDMLFASGGRNSLYGGDGADLFVITDGDEAGFNVLFDFNPDDGDRIVFSGSGAPVDIADILANGRIHQGGAHTLITYGDTNVQLLGFDATRLNDTNLLFNDAAAIPTFGDAAGFVESGLDAALTEVTIGNTLYRLRDDEPLHADFKFQDGEGRWWSPDYFVIVAAGQSNMLGAGTGGDMMLDPNVIAYDWVGDSLVLADYAAPPAGGEGVRTGTALRNNMFFPFANEIAAEMGRPVLVIAHPVSGSRIDSWLADGVGTLWTDLTGDIDHALDLIGQSSIDSFIWHQGESDFPMDPADYQARLVDFIGQIRAADWAPSDLPILIGELSRMGINHAQNAALQAIEIAAAADPYLRFVSSTGLDTFDRASIHFDGPALVEFGQRFYAALADILDGTSIGPLPVNTAPTLATALPIAITVLEGDTFSLDLGAYFADAEGDAFWAYGHLDRRDVFLTDGNGDTLILTPDYDASGTYTLRVFVNDYMLDSESYDITLTVVDRDPAVVAYSNRNFDVEIGSYRDLGTSLADMKANRGVDILSQDALSATNPTLIEIDALNIRADGGITGTFAMGTDVLRLYLGGDADLDVIGNGIDNLVTGNAGANEMYGGDGRDRLYGEGADDFLFGGAGDDRLYGGDGDDWLDGGTGADQAWGGAGTDTFVFAQGSGQFMARDYVLGEDRLVLSGFAGASDFDTMMATARILDSGDRVIIDIGADRLLVYGIDPVDLVASMFDFV